MKSELKCNSAKVWSWDMCREGKKTHQFCAPLKITTKLASGQEVWVCSKLKKTKEESVVTNTGGDSLSFRIIRKL